LAAPPNSPTPPVATAEADTLPGPLEFAVLSELALPPLVFTLAPPEAFAVEVTSPDPADVAALADSALPPAPS
jgi:hypothetical protein